MRKWVAIIVVVIIGVWLLMWAGATVMSSLYTRDAEHPWPLGLGTLATADRRYPPAPSSPAAYQLISAAAKLGINIVPRNDELQPEESANTRANPQLRRAILDYLNAQIENPTANIDQPPPEVGDYLAAHAADFAAVRAISGDDVAWVVDYPNRAAPIPNLLGHMVLSRALLVNALDRARRNDAGAWDDAQAVVALSRNLWSRPEFVSSLIALAMARSVNAVARKFPLPPPAWFVEFQKFDYARAMLAARQAETAAIAKEQVEAETTGGRRIVDTVTAPYIRLSAADALEIDRQMSLLMTANRTCVLDPRSIARERRARLAWWNVPARRVVTPNLDAAWQRVFRFRAELEATERALRLRAAQPPLPESACEGARWIYTDTGFRLSKDIPLPSPTRIPLEFHTR